jgi:hypothetical protein
VRFETHIIHLFGGLSLSLLQFVPPVFVMEGQIHEPNQGENTQDEENAQLLSKALLGDDILRLPIELPGGTVMPVVKVRY